MNNKTNPTGQANMDKSLPQEIDKYEREPMIRGALKIDVSTSTNLVSAGKEFSIYVVIHNPFDIPITLHRTETHIPVELSDEIAKFKRHANLTKERRELENKKSIFERVKKQFRFWVEDITENRNLEKAHRVAEAVGVEFERIQSKIRPVIFSADGHGSAITVARDVIAGDMWNLDFATMSKDEVRQILWDIEQYVQGKTPVILQPGNSVVRHFVLKTTKWLLFAPLAHTFQIQVTYDVTGKYQTDTIPFSVNIQASMFSALVGAVVGSLLGSFVRTPPQSTSTFEIGRIMLTSAIFAVIIVVAFARKSNVQQIVSVEDFWGGMFIGFLTGYAGESFITSILGHPSAG
jgi:hypothetical protein